MCRTRFADVVGTGKTQFAGKERERMHLKKLISIVLALILLCSCVLIGSPSAYAAPKTGETRAIGIVFDNSGSMYKNDNQAWCRATYATEVFASMLNAGDVLQIYPMNPIEVGGKQYSMENPFVLTDASQASKIREIITPGRGDTHIESIKCAVEGLKKTSANLKYLVVLTDGDEFYENKQTIPETTTQKRMQEYFTAANNANASVMYLGIGAKGKVIMPNMSETDMFKKWQAEDSGNVLSDLTEICNQIFGRDTLPDNRISGKNVNFDVSMKKLIVFVQGENISDLKVTDSSGNLVGIQTGSQQAKYAEKGSDTYTCVADKTLQGMMVTYEDCAAGQYTISHKGTATSVKIYYEPDADLDFVFTDSDGNTVDPNALYEGQYKVSFGMKDAKTGQLISSDLLGNPRYQGNYYIDGTKYPFTHEGFSGSVDVPLLMGQKFEADLTVTYLSGYTISKNSSDFGWPAGGIQVAARPAGDFRLEISGGDSSYPLQRLEDGAPFAVKVYYKDEQLTGSDLEKVNLTWDAATSNADIEKTLEGDHYQLKLHYKDPDAPQDTVCGKCTVSLQATYTAQGSDEARTQGFLTYHIKDDFAPVQLELSVPQTYIVIKELEQSQPVTVYLKMNGVAMTAEEFAATTLTVNCGGIEYKLTPDAQNSSYTVKLMPTEGIAEGDYEIKVTAVHTDQIGRQTQIDESVVVTLSNTPLWLKWVIGFLLVLILFLIIWAILHIKVLPTKAHTTKKLSSMNFDGEDVTKSTSFLAEIKKNGARTQAQYGGRKFGIMMDVTPGPESYLCKSQKRRSAEVKPASVRKYGPAKIQEALIGTAKYVADDNGKLIPALPNQKPFQLKNGMTVRYSGTLSDAGIDKDFEVLSKINFKKK